MAQFRATIRGARGEASRLGHKGSGIMANINGWNGGVRVWARYNAHTGADEFEVYATGGSNGARHSMLIGTVTSTGVFIPAPQIPQQVAA